MDHSPPGSSVHGILQARILSGLLCPSGNFSHPGIEPASTVSPAFQADSLPLSHQGILRGNRLAANKGVTGFPGWAVVKKPLANTGDTREGLDPWVRKTSWNRKGNSLQSSCLEIPEDRGAWQESRRSQEADTMECARAHTHIYTHTLFQILQ